MRTRLYKFVIVIGFFSGIIFSAAPANAYADISIQGYRGSSGSFTAVSDGGTIPSGAQLDVKVWIDSAYGSIYIDWGDGTSDPVTGTSWAVTKYHTYSKDGTYTIKAIDGSGQQGDIQTIKVGGTEDTGGGSGFSPDFSGIIIVISIITLVASLAAIGTMLESLKVISTDTSTTNRPPTRKPKKMLKTTISHSMAQYLVTYDKIPIGAPVQNPELAVEMGRPTDIHEQPTCRGCRGPLGYHMNGWFCLSPNCSLLV